MTCRAIPDIDPAELKDGDPDLVWRLQQLLSHITSHQHPDLIGWAVQHLRHRLTTYNPLAPLKGMSQFHLDLAETLDAATHKRGQRVCRLAPRGSAKTTLAALAYPLREALEGREPYTLLVGDTQTSARLFLDNIKRELETNVSLAAAYPKLTGAGPVWNQDVIRLANGCEIEAISTGAAIRGRLKRTRPRLIIADDLQGKDDVISPILRGRAWDWFLADLLPLGEPDTNVIVNATAIHRDCIGYKLLSTPGWETRVYKAMIEAPSNAELWDAWERILHDGQPDATDRARAFYDAHAAAMDEGSSVLWPARFPIYDLMLKLVSGGPAAFGSEYQNNPTNPELSEWPEEYFDDKARPEFWFDRWEDIKALQIKTVALDPSKGSRDRLGDYSALILFGRDVNGIEYVEADLFRGSSEATTDAIIRKSVQHCREFRPEAMGFEAVLFQQLFGRLLGDAFAAAGLDTRLIPMTDPTPKDVRIRRLTTPLAQRKMRFRRTKSTMMLVDQLRDFGPAADKVDGPDATEMARRLAIEIWNGKQNQGRQGPTVFRA